MRVETGTEKYTAGSKKTILTGEVHLIKEKGIEKKGTGVMASSTKER